MVVIVCSSARGCKRSTAAGGANEQNDDLGSIWGTTLGNPEHKYRLIGPFPKEKKNCL